MHFTIRPREATMPAAHARSASLPCQHSHPIITCLNNRICELRSWSDSASSSNLAGQPSGVALMDAVLSALGELLTLPQAVAALHDAATCDEILDRFLALADAYGTFQSALVTVKQSVVELQVGTRHGDGVAIAASLREHRRAAKGLCHLGTMMRHTSRMRLCDVTDSEDVIRIVTEAITATMEASEGIFLGCAAMSPDVPAMAPHCVSAKKWLPRLSVKPSAKKEESPTTAVALKRLEQLEECIDGLERGSDKVFRRLLQSRVSLLNIHNPF